MHYTFLVSLDFLRLINQLGAIFNSKNLGTHDDERERELCPVARSELPYLTI